MEYVKPSLPFQSPWMRNIKIETWSKSTEKKRRRRAYTEIRDSTYRHCLHYHHVSSFFSLFCLSFPNPPKVPAPQTMSCIGKKSERNCFFPSNEFGFIWFFCSILLGEGVRRLLMEVYKKGRTEPKRGS